MDENFVEEIFMVIPDSTISTNLKIVGSKCFKSLVAGIYLEGGEPVDFLLDWLIFKVFSGGAGACLTANLSVLLLAMIPSSLL